jgi:HTH-type transcriptional regulator/antitoxin HigA
MEAVNLALIARLHAEFLRAGGVGAVRNEADYERALALIKAILDQTRNTPAREDPNHALTDLLDLLMTSVRGHEALHHRLPNESATIRDM